MDDEIRSMILTLVRLLRMQQEKVLNLNARVYALQTILARVTRMDDAQAEAKMQKLIEQFRSTEPDAEARAQVDAIVVLLEKGKHPGSLDG